MEIARKITGLALLLLGIVALWRTKDSNAAIAGSILAVGGALLLYS